MLLQKRIGMFDMRKIQIGQVGQLLAVDVARLNHYSPRPRRTFSEIELIFKESTNVRAWGMRRSAKLVPLSRVGIFLPYSTSLLLTAVLRPGGSESFHAVSVLGSVIVSPIFITRSSAFILRFFSSRSNASGVPVSTGKVA